MRLLALVGIFATALFGQSADTGLGSVTDQSNAAVVGATVTIASPATGFNRSVVTGPDGQYEVRYLLPEDYVVQVRMNGFRPERTAGITLRIGQLPRVDFKLQVGAVSEAVEVSAQGVLLDTQSGTMAAGFRGTNCRSAAERTQLCKPGEPHSGRGGIRHVVRGQRRA